VLVANRGEIACRVLRTAKRLGIRTIAVYSEADESSVHVGLADEAVPIGPADPRQSYLVAEKILDAARKTGAASIHPGYGFLSENAAFARAVTNAGIGWVGPSPESMELMADKVQARNVMSDAGVPVARGTRHAVSTVDEAVAAAGQVGYPLMVKATAGGGGLGMGVVHDESGLAATFERTSGAGQRFFGDPGVLLEEYLPAARHVEIQVLGLADGRVIALGERDCSVQRRHQKVIEETPSPGVSQQLRDQMLAAAVKAAQAVEYRGAGTVECLVDEREQRFVFLEMNTRLQVEHPITELVTGLDLVEQQFRIAAGESVDIEPVRTNGHAIEFRIYAEDPVRFLPSPGTIDEWVEPDGVRVDAGYRAGDVVTPFYDPLLAKLCVHAENRSAAVTKARKALDSFKITGLRTNLVFLREVLDNQEFCGGGYDTGLVDRMRAR
jgi:acetyl-CoA carboxylase biotin carboxylase subunit